MADDLGPASASSGFQSPGCRTWRNAEALEEPPCVSPSQGGKKDQTPSTFPPLRSFEVALLESRPEGAATLQPRAPPWELDRVLSVELFRPFRAGRILIRIGSPGRCPGLFCFGP